MEPELSEVEEITQALDYLADHNYNPAQRKILDDCLIPMDHTFDLDAVKDVFANNRGIISQLNILLLFVKKYRTNEDLINELQSEMQYLMASIDGESGGNISI